MVCNELLKQDDIIELDYLSFIMIKFNDQRKELTFELVKVTSWYLYIVFCGVIGKVVLSIFDCNKKTVNKI